MALAACGTSTGGETGPGGPYPPEGPGQHPDHADASTVDDAGTIPQDDASVGDGSVGPGTSSEWPHAGTFTQIYDTSKGTTSRYINDHTFVRAADGTWHLFGIVGVTAAPGSGPDSSKEVSFAHATAKDLSGPWTAQPDVMQVDKSYFNEAHVWAPHVIEDGGTYYMFYAAGAGQNAAINLATSKDLYSWTRRPEGPLFRDGLEARDPYVMRIGSEWVMYYCATTTATGGAFTVVYRKSSDLIHWGARNIAFVSGSRTDNYGFPDTESPFVVEHEGNYYLFIGPRRGYVGTDIFQSSDPFHFDLKGYHGHVASHAAEIVQDGNRQWISHSGWFQSGVWLAPFEWHGYPDLWPTREDPAVVFGKKGLNVFPAEDVAPTWSKNKSGLVELFTVHADTGKAVRRVELASGDWGSWEDFYDGAGAAPVIAQAADGRLEAFILGQNGTTVVHRAQDANGAWGAPEPFGDAADEPPSVARNADGRLEVFLLPRGAASIQHRYQLQANGAWSGWEDFGGPSGSNPVVGANLDGRLEVLVVKPYGTGVAHRYQTQPSGGWSAWEVDFGGWLESPPVIAQNADGRLEVFAVAPGGTSIAHRYQEKPNGKWLAWEPNFGGAAAYPPTVTRWPDGRLEAFVRTPDGKIRRRAQTAPNGGWAAWQTY